MPATAECVILIGLPAAGKTSLYRTRFAQTHAHISKDLGAKPTARGASQQQALEKLLDAGSSVVIDNTNPTIAERKAIIGIARAHSARVIGYFFDVTTRVAVARNSERTGRGKVPNVAIFTAAKRLQRPSMAEGFDHLYRVEISEERDFRISRM